ncbi:MAG: hypothetical protein ACRCR2_02590 [Fusobacteriaceae bacterium]
MYKIDKDDPAWKFYKYADVPNQGIYGIRGCAELFESQNSWEDLQMKVGKYLKKVERNAIT